MSEQLLRNLFFKNSPLHDGAVIVRGGRVAAAGCVMPLSDNPHLPSDLGTRHRAGVGTSEVSDAVVVIVSEENGTISVAIGGMLKRHLAPQTLQRLLSNELLADEAEKKTLLKRLAAALQQEGRFQMKSKLFSLIVSVLAAMCLWVYVMTVVNPDVDLTIGNIPVTFSGAEVLREDHGLVITGDYQEFVSVHFYGKNADLKTLDQHKDELKAVIDVSKVRSTKDYTMSYDITLPSAVSASSITKMDKSPANITFTVERQIRKSVEVRGDFSSVKIAEGYMLDSTSFDFDSITIEGPESVVNTVDHAPDHH